MKPAAGEGLSNKSSNIIEFMSGLQKHRAAAAAAGEGARQTKNLVAAAAAAAAAAFHIIIAHVTHAHERHRED